MKDYLTKQGFNEVAPGLWLRSPARVDVTADGVYFWSESGRKEVNFEELKKCIEETKFRTKLKK